MDVLIVFFFFIFGTIAASFFHVVILRLHSGKEGIILGRSECPKCHHILSFFDLVPLLSYLTLGAKCRYCKEKISINYFCIEVVTGLLFAYAAFHFLSQFEHNMVGYFLLMFVYLFYLSALILITFYDLYFYIIPDSISLPAIVLALACVAFPFTPSFIDALFGALIPFTFFALQIIVSRGKWIGGGDLRLALLMGIMLGPAKVIVALFVAYFVGSILGVALILIRKKTLKSRIPFGPFLSFGTIIALFWGTEMIDWYWNVLILGG